MNRQTRISEFVKGLRTRMRARYRKDHVCSVAGPCQYGTSDIPSPVTHEWLSNKCRHAIPHSKVGCGYTADDDRCCGFAYGVLRDLGGENIHCIKIKEIR